MGEASEEPGALLRELAGVRCAGEGKGKQDGCKGYKLFPEKPAFHADSLSGH